MGRPYTAEEYLTLSTKITHLIPDMAITTDVIVGFPGETEKEFSETCEFVKVVGFAKLHVFPYSEREGTRAAKMPDSVPVEARKQRADELRRIGEQLSSAFKNRFLDRGLEVLFEEQKRGFWYGLTSNYIRVKYQSEDDLTNRILAVRLKKDNLV
jgi:threonylcarbamoyladenosine tRNA methylthiotransferase MtaB